MLDWNDLRFFLAVARGKTLARAAAALGVDQTTAGRRIAALETRMRVELFTRSASGLALSAAGARVLEAAERMDEAAQEIAARAPGDDAPATGTVRVATTDSLAAAFVVPAMRALREKNPAISVVISTGFALADLRKGDADLAVRLVRPTDPRLAARKLADFALRLYASRDYIAKHGTPRSFDGHALIAYEDATRTGARYPFGDRRDVAVMSNNHFVLLAAASAGLGIVQLPSYVGDAHPELVHVFAERDDPYTVWLVVPQAKRRVAAVRAVSEAIAGAFRAPGRAGRSPSRARRRS
jgi:DNA-binding transcriptional LysR family regulator